MWRTTAESIYVQVSHFSSRYSSKPLQVRARKSAWIFHLKFPCRCLAFGKWQFKPTIIYGTKTPPTTIFLAGHIYFSGFTINYPRTHHTETPVSFRYEFLTYS